MHPHSFSSSAMNNLSQLALLALAILVPLSSWAQNVVEFSGDSGTDEFSDPESWKGGKIPGPEDTALFSLPGSTKVTLTEDIEVARLKMTENDHAIEPNTVTLALEGGVLTLSGVLSPDAKTNQWPIVLNPSSQAARTLRIENGTLNFQGIWMSTLPGNFPSVFILDQGVTAQGKAMGYIGAYGLGEAYILGGSKWVVESNSSIGALGHSETGGGLLEISGKGSSFTALTDEDVAKADRCTLFVSTKGSGTLRILDGGSFACDAVNMGNGSSGKMDAKAFSTVLVDGAESTFATQILNVGAGSNNLLQPPIPSGNALLAVTNGGIANIGSLHVFSVEAKEGTDPAFGRVLVAGGTLNLGVASETMLSAFLPGSLLEVRLREVPKTAPINAPGELIIEGASFKVSLDPAFRAKVGDLIPLVDGEIITGTFADLPEGSTITADGYTFTLTYGSTKAAGLGLKVTAAP